MEICINLGSALNAEELKGLERAAESRGCAQQEAAQHLVKAALGDAMAAAHQHSEQMREEKREEPSKTVVTKNLAT